MAKYRNSNEAKEDLIRIHHYGVEKFGISQADKYFNTFFEYFDIIAQRPFAFESVDYIKKGYSKLAILPGLDWKIPLIGRPNFQNNVELVL